MEVTQTKRAWKRQREIIVHFQKRILREEKHEKKQGFEEISFLNFECEKNSANIRRKNLGTIPKTNLQQARILRLYRTVLYNKVFKVICTTIGIVLYNTIFEVKVQHLMLFIQHKFRDSGTCFFKAKKQHRNRGRTTGRIIAHVSPYNMEIEASVQQFVSARLT